MPNPRRSFCASGVDIIMPMQEQETINRIKAFFETPTGRRTALWLAYFVFWSGLAAYLPYIAVYYESIGLMGGEIGRLNSIPYFVTLVSSIVFAFLSDKFGQHKLILRVTSVGIIAILLIYPSARSFSALIPIVLAYSVLHAPSNAILDETTLSTLENPEHYGKIRVGGTIGWGIMVVVTGFLIDHLSLGLNVIFYVHMFFSLLFLAVVAIIPDPHPHSSKTSEQVSLKKVAAVLRQPGFLLFLVLIVLWGIGESSIGNFLFLHIKSLGGSSTLMGTALAVSLVGEIVVFSFADKFHSRFKPEVMVLMAFIVLFAWLVGLSLIKNPFIIPFFQVFGGAGFALLQSGSVNYVDQRAPREIGTTVQAIRGGIYSGLGVGVGAIISGFIYEAAGSAALFRVMALIALGGFIFGLSIQLHERRRKQPNGNSDG